MTRSGMRRAARALMDSRGGICEEYDRLLARAARVPCEEIDERSPRLDWILREWPIGISLSDGEALRIEASMLMSEAEAPCWRCEAGAGPAAK